MKTVKLLSTVCCLFALGINPAFAAIAVIVNPDNANQLGEREVRQIFLGQIKTFPDGLEAQTLDNMTGALRGDFISKVLKRNESTMNAYWARMLFTAKAIPPRELADSGAVKKAVADNKNAIGYIDASQVDDSVKVLMTIE
ncbi:MAG TPA: hypothetical protein VIN71_11015 [Pseudomonadales bacterium]